MSDINNVSPLYTVHLRLSKSGTNQQTSTEEALSEAHEKIRKLEEENKRFKEQMESTIYIGAKIERNEEHECYTYVVAGLTKEDVLAGDQLDDGLNRRVGNSIDDDKRIESIALQTFFEENGSPQQVKIDCGIDEEVEEYLAELQGIDEGVISY
jgi:hypothetical protein